MKTRTRTIAIIAASALLLIAGACAFFGMKYRHYIAFCRSVDVSLKEAKKIYGPMNAENEWTMSLVVEADRGNWDKVASLTEKDRRSVIGTYYHNIAAARRGRLAEDLLKYYQPFEIGLFLPVREGETPFSIGCASEVWWQLGELTLAEHAAMLGMIFSPHQSGERFYRRLAQIQLANSDGAAARKYIEKCRSRIGDEWKEKAGRGPSRDTLVFAGQDRAALLNLLEGTQGYNMAYEYLLCLDLLIKDLPSFAEDYDPARSRSRLYDEGITAWLAINNNLSSETAAQYGLEEEVLNDFFRYTETYNKTGGSLKALQPEFGQTFWFWFHFAKRNEK